mgnify:CR=1 FL=1
MFFKFLSTFVAIALTLAPLSAHAVTPPLPLQGKVTSILKDAKAPYSGILLDPLAASKMLVDQKLKNNRIADLDVMLKKEMSRPNTSQWWLAGGIVIGIVLSVAVFYASVEISR